ncbi:MAG: HAD-IA family hydrolase [Steroidobacterales bacterium]
MRALIFDVDGTLADTESVHRTAFNAAFAEAGLDWHWDEPLYGRLLEVSGGKERITHYWTNVRGDLPAQDASTMTDTVKRLHDLKTAVYSRLVDGGVLQLRPGVRQLIESACKAGLRLAIATTTSPANIEALLRSTLGTDGQARFEVIEDAATAPRKKPHPQVYLQTLQRMDLDAAECLAFEDSANGLQAATRAGLLTIVTPNAFTAHQDFSAALRILPSLQGVTIADLRAWHAAAAQPAAAPENRVASHP